MKYCKESLLFILFGALVLATSCSGFGKGTCDRCPEFTQADEVQNTSDNIVSTKEEDAE